MRGHIAGASLIAAVTAALAAWLILALPEPAPVAAAAPEPVYDAHSMLKVRVGQGHGSGFHIGGGYVLTAAHVVDTASDKNVLTLKDDSGRIHSAEILWQNKEYDIALLLSPHMEEVEPVHLSCIVPAKGTDVRAAGNPLSMENIDTWGKVSGGIVDHYHWKEALPSSLPVYPGMSGGPVLDSNGDVVGMAVGYMAVVSGFMPSWTEMGLIIPGSTICKLLARV